MRWADPDRFVADTMTATTGVQTIHHGFEPEIEILSDDGAKAIWPFEDRAWLAAPNAAIPFKGFIGYGYYHDRYRKVDGAWKISTPVSSVRGSKPADWEISASPWLR